MKTQHHSRHTAAFALALAALLCTASAWADLSKKTAKIENVSIKIKPDCDAAPNTIILGDIDITLENVGTGAEITNVMRGILNIRPELQGPNSGGTYVWDCIQLHYVQMITQDPDPIKRKGVTTKIPVIDPPRGGWDYMFEGPNGTGAVKDGFDVFIDDLPWYWNAKGEATYFDLCKRYEINDNPAALNGDLVFSTFLVATGVNACGAMPDCLLSNEFLVLAGWEWSESTTNLAIPTIYNNATFPIATLNTALTNAYFTGQYAWTAVKDKAVCCPEPGTYALMAGILVVALLSRMRRSTRAA
jgi:hypothetical protein